MRPALAGYHIVVFENHSHRDVSLAVARVKARVVGENLLNSFLLPVSQLSDDFWDSALFCFSEVHFPKFRNACPVSFHAFSRRGFHRSTSACSYQGGTLVPWQYYR